MPTDSDSRRRAISAVPPPPVRLCLCRSIMPTAIPANMCYFGGYELGKRLTPRNLGVLSDMMTASMANSIAGVIYCPIDIVKQRVQVGAGAGGVRRVLGLGACRWVLGLGGRRWVLGPGCRWRGGCVGLGGGTLSSARNSQVECTVCFVGFVFRRPNPFFLAPAPCRPSRC